jgi:hypothetical protein
MKPKNGVRGYGPSHETRIAKLRRKWRVMRDKDAGEILLQNLA